MKTISVVVALIATTFLCPALHAQCVEVGPFHNFTGSGTVACPCFAVGEEAGAVLDVPASEYPIEILKIGIGWGSQFGGAGQTQEQAIHIYSAGLPNPGVPIFSLVGPILTDGVINEYDISTIPGTKTLAGGPFVVSLEFLNGNAGNVFAPSVVHDGNGCQFGKNVVKAIPGGWNDACALGVSGDWVIYVKYRSLKSIVAGSPANVDFVDVPVSQTQCDTMYVRNEGCDTLNILGINGCDTGPFALDTTSTSHAIAPGDSTGIVVCFTPGSASPEGCSVTVATSAANGGQTFTVTGNGVATGIATPGLAGTLGDVAVIPNPFNPTTHVQLELSQSAVVSVEVFDVRGKRVRGLLKAQRVSAGTHSIEWDGTNDRGQGLASGVYLVRITTPQQSSTVRAMLLK